MTTDLLPTFAQRARLCMVSKKALRLLEWRSTPPVQLCEEMSGLNLGDAGARAVALAGVKPHHPSMGELCLSSNNIGNAGTVAISALLRDGCKIRRLSLTDNGIGDAGSHALAAALAVNTSLEELDLWGNSITDAGKAALLAAAKCKVFFELEVAPFQTSVWVRCRMRAVLFEWISQVQTCAQGALDGNGDPQDLLFQIFSFIDGYFACRRVNRSHFQLIGVAATLAAVSNGAPHAAHHNDDLAAWLASMTNGGYTAENVKEAGCRIIKMLRCKLHTPTAYTFLRRYLRKTGRTQESWTSGRFFFATYLTELAVTNGGLSQYSPQAIAAAAAVLSRQYTSQGIGFQNIRRWKRRLLQCSRLDVAIELAPCVAALSRLHVAEHGCEYRFVNKKYTCRRFHMVAKIKPNPSADADCIAAYLSSPRSWEAGQTSGVGSPR